MATGRLVGPPPRARAPGTTGCAALRPAGCGTPGRLAAFPIRRPSCVAAARVFRLSWPLRVSLSSSVKRPLRIRRARFYTLPAAARRPGSPPARGAVWLCGVDNRSGTSEASRRAAPARPGARGRLNISFRREPERPPHKARHKARHAETLLCAATSMCVLITIINNMRVNYLRIVNADVSRPHLHVPHIEALRCTSTLRFQSDHNDTTIV